MVIDRWEFSGWREGFVGERSILVLDDSYLREFVFRTVCVVSYSSISLRGRRVFEVWVVYIEMRCKCSICIGF